MKVLGIRFCCVSEDAEALAKVLDDGLALPILASDALGATDVFKGSVFEAGSS